jgi:hypothetical protein
MLLAVSCRPLGRFDLDFGVEECRGSLFEVIAGLDLRSHAGK